MNHRAGAGALPQQGQGLLTWCLLQCMQVEVGDKHYDVLSITGQNLG